MKKDTISIEKFTLGRESDFSLYQFLVTYSDKDYVKDVFVKYKDEVVAKNYPETLEFFSILDSLVKKGLNEGDKNPFFTYKQKTEKGNSITRSLQFNNVPTIYISPSSAKTMCQFYNESKIGLSFKTVLKSDVIFSIDVELKTTSKKADFSSEDELNKVINSLLDKNGIEYNNTNYYSRKITDLINSVKYK